MNPERLMLRFAEGLQTQLAERQRAGETPARRNSQLRLGRGILLKNRWIPAWLRRIFSPDILTVTIVTALILVFISWGLGTVLLKADELVPQATAPGLAAALLPSATPAPSATPNVEASPTAIFIEDSEALPTEEFVLPEFNINQVQLFIITNQRAYLKVTVDGKVAFDGRVNAGANLPYTGNQSVEVLTGNGAAVQVFYNDRNMGTLGIFGEVVNLIYTLDGVVIPTSSAPPVTATSTPAGP